MRNGSPTQRKIHRVYWFYVISISRNSLSCQIHKGITMVDISKSEMREKVCMIKNYVPACCATCVNKPEPMTSWGLCKISGSAVERLDLCSTHYQKIHSNAQQVDAIMQFDPDNFHCPNSCLCAMCKNDDECETACNEYLRMANGCTDHDNCNFPKRCIK